MGQFFVRKQHAAQCESSRNFYLGPQIKKIRFQGDISEWSFQIGYASVVRVSETEFRNYTIVNHDREKVICLSLGIVRELPVLRAFDDSGHKPFLV